MSNSAQPAANTPTKRLQAEKRAFTTAEAAIYIGRSSSWLRKRRLRGVSDPGDPGPPFLKTPTGAALYLRERLDDYLDKLDQASALRLGDLSSPVVGQLDSGREIVAACAPGSALRIKRGGGK